VDPQTVDQNYAQLQQRSRPGSIGDDIINKIF